MKHPEQLRSLSQASHAHIKTLDLVFDTQTAVWLLSVTSEMLDPTSYMHHFYRFADVVAMVTVSV